MAKLLGRFKSMYVDTTHHCDYTYSPTADTVAGTTICIMIPDESPCSCYWTEDGKRVKCNHCRELDAAYLGWLRSLWSRAHVKVLVSQRGVVSKASRQDKEVLLELRARPPQAFRALLEGRPDSGGLVNFEPGRLGWAVLFLHITCFVVLSVHG